MPPPGEPAPLEQWSAEELPRLAELYDRFAHALDPFDAGRDVAEQTLSSDITGLYDCLSSPKPSLRDFRRHVIGLCKKHLKASDKTSAP